MVHMSAAHTYADVIQAIRSAHGTKDILALAKQERDEMCKILDTVDVWEDEELFFELVDYFSSEDGKTDRNGHRALLEGFLTGEELQRFNQDWIAHFLACAISGDPDYQVTAMHNPPPVITDTMVYKDEGPEYLSLITDYKMQRIMTVGDMLSLYEHLPLAFKVAVVLQNGIVF